MLMVLATCIFISCSKDQPANAPAGSNEPVATFRLRVNGILSQWDGPGSAGTVCFFCGPALTNRSTYFILSSSDPRNYFSRIDMTIKSGSLNISRYGDTLTTAIGIAQAIHQVNTNLTFGAATEVGDFATITITSIKDGKYYDGTFSARFTAPPFGTAANKVYIEDGEFRNLKVN